MMQNALFAMLNTLNKQNPSPQLAGELTNLLEQTKQEIDNDKSAPLKRYLNYHLSDLDWNNLFVKQWSNFSITN